MTTSQTSRPAGDNPTPPGETTTSSATGRPIGPSQRATGRTWTIAMPARQKLLNANNRLNRYAKARIVKQLRTDGFKLAKLAKVPLLQRAQIDCVYEPPTNGRRDAANWQDSAKAITDGFVDAGVLRDDSTAYLDGPFMHIGEKHPGGRLVLIITELETPE